MFNLFETNEKKVESKFNCYIKEKYNLIFDILKIGQRSKISKHIDIIAKVDKFANEEIKIRYYPRKNFGYLHPLFKDNYVEIANKNELNNKITKVLFGIYRVYKVKINSLTPTIVLPKEINLNTSIDEIFKNKEISPYIEIYVYDMEIKKDERAKKVVVELERIMNSGDIIIRYVTEFDDIDTEYLSGFISFDKLKNKREISWRS